MMELIADSFDIRWTGNCWGNGYWIHLHYP